MRTLLAACLLLLAGCASVAPVEPPIASEHDCPAEGWCWVRGRPLVVGGDRDRGTVFAIGAEGSFLRWEDDHWASAPVPTRRTLLSAWVGSDVDAWVSDDGGSAWHFDGSTWTEAPAESPIQRIMATPDGSVWALAGGSAGAHGGSSGARVLRREDDRWVDAIEPYEYCLDGDFIVREGGEVWTAGLTCVAGVVDAVEVRRYDGTSWQLVGEPIPEQGWFPRFEWIGGRVRVHATGTFEWDGTSWSAFVPPGYPQSLPPDETAAQDGLGYTILPRSLDCSGAYRLDDTHVWCFADGQIHVQDGDTWRPTLVDAFADTQDAARWGTIPPALWAGSDTHRAWGSGPTNVYRLRHSTGSQLERFDGAAWTTVREARVNDIDGASAGDVWLATESGPVHYDGSVFAPVPIPSELATDETLRVHALGGGAAVFLTESALLAFAGAWTMGYTAPDNWRLVDVAGSGANDLWVMTRRQGRTNEAALVHFDGAEWSEVDVPGLTVFGELATLGTETWLSTDGLVVHLGSTDAPITSSWRAFDASLWIGADALWLTTNDQSRRYALP